MDQFKTIEEPSGCGTFERDGEVVLSPVQYRVVITQKLPDTDSHGEQDEFAGLRRVTGSLLVDDPSQIRPLIGLVLELVLADGRRWPCVITPEGNLRGAWFFP